MTYLNPFKPNVINLNSPFLFLWSVEWSFSFIFIFLLNSLQANSGDHDQTPCSVASGLGLHYLPTSHKKDARLILVYVYVQDLEH